MKPADYENLTPYEREIIKLLSAIARDMEALRLEANE